MQLGTFGAIMGFAMELERRAISFYDVEAEGLPEEVREDLAKNATWRLRRVEKARREGVVELALESITGFDGDNYAVESLLQAAGEASLPQAIVLEETCSRFYRDAALKLPIREIARLFDRLAQGNEENLERLKALGAGVGRE